MIESDIRSCSSTKGYMQGFKGFADVVSKIKDKLMKKSSVCDDNSWAVDVDYSGTPIIEQIQHKILGAIKRINTPILNLMKIFQMDQVSLYCTEISSLDDLCSIYQSSSRHHGNIFDKEHHLKQKQIHDTEEITERLSKLALDFISGNGTDTPLVDELIDHAEIATNKLASEPDSSDCWIEFDCENFYDFIGQDVNNANVGRLLNHMSNSISNSMERKRVDGSITELQKVQSLKGRWFNVKSKNVEDYGDGENISRNDIYKIRDDFYRVLCVLKKTYNKWRMETYGKKNENLKIHLQMLDQYQGKFQVDEKHKYICISSKDIGIYIGHAFAVNNI